MKIIKNLIVNIVISWALLFVFNHYWLWIKIMFWLSCPVNFLTFWLASIVINVVVFYMFAYVVNNYLDWEVMIKLWQVWQTLILSIIMGISISILTKIL